MTTNTSMRGYTLLEMIVAVGIFSVLMLAATGAYLSLISLDKRARATTDVVTNLSFAIDSMSREIRTGTDYMCNNSSGAPNCTLTPGSSLGFTDSRSPGRTVVYTLSNGQILATINGTTYPITDPRITVAALKFYVRGVGESDGIQPQVTLTVRGTIPASSGQTVTFTVEGGATQRLIEL